MEENKIVNNADAGVSAESLIPHENSEAGIKDSSRSKNNIIMISLVIAIALIIAGVYYVRGNSSPQNEALKCIAEKSTLYVSKTCSHCAAQKKILGNGLKYFKMIDCLDESGKCVEANVTAVPTWVINGTNYEGVRSIEELKRLAGC